MKTPILFLSTKILACVGILLSLYLLWQQMYRPAFQPCTINASINCDAIISGPVAKTLGIPTPLFGLIGYIVIFIAATIRMKKLLLGMSLFGLLFCLWIAYQELFLLKVICPVCIACQVIMFFEFSFALFLLKQKDAPLGLDLTNEGK